VKAYGMSRVKSTLEIALEYAGYDLGENK